MIVLPMCILSSAPTVQIAVLLESWISVLTHRGAGGGATAHRPSEDLRAMCPSRLESSAQVGMTVSD